VACYASRACSLTRLVPSRRPIGSGSPVVLCCRAVAQILQPRWALRHSCVGRAGVQRLSRPSRGHTLSRIRRYRRAGPATLIRAPRSRELGAGAAHLGTSAASRLHCLMHTTPLACADAPDSAVAASTASTSWQTRNGRTCACMDTPTVPGRWTCRQRRCRRRCLSPRSASTSRATACR